MVPSPTAAPGSAPASGPELPLRAWSVSAGDGEVFVVDAGWRVYRLAAQSLQAQARSEPLFPPGTPGRGYLLAAKDQIFAGSEAMTQTLVLDRANWARQASLDRAGSLAVDPGRRLFVVWQRGVWAFDLAALSRPPVVVVAAPQPGMGWVAVNVTADAATRQLYVTMHDASASPPHQREAYQVYDLDTLQLRRSYQGELGTLSRPVTMTGARRVISVLSALSGLLGSGLTVYDADGSVLRRQGPLDGVPAADSDGRWIYLARSRDLWVLRGSELGLRSVVPLPTWYGQPIGGSAGGSGSGDQPARDLALAPDAATLYLFGSHGVQAMPAPGLQQAGIVPVDAAALLDWAGPQRQDFERARIFPSPAWEQDHTVFALVGGYGDLYRTIDGGRNWQFLVELTYPKMRYLTHLSPSPDFAIDRTLTVHTIGGNPGLRSTDAGSTWQAFTPRLAFVSERDGNREIYTAAQDGGDVRRVTFSAAADENPAWSPAWTRLAFQSNRNGNWDIFSVRAGCQPGPAEACDLRQLTDSSADDVLPAWSPDGTMIAFVSTRDGNPELYVMPVTGGAARRLTDDPAGDWRPAWRPDGQQLLFASGRGGSNGIYSLSVPADRTAPGHYPAVAPIVTSPGDNRDPAVSSGNRLLFLSDRDGLLRAYTLDLAFPGSQPYAGSYDRQAEGHPAWVDDSSAAYLASMVRDGVEGIYRVTLTERTPLIVGSVYNGQPAWGPVPWRPAADAGYQWLSPVAGK